MRYLSKYGAKNKLHKGSMSVRAKDSKNLFEIKQKLKNPPLLKEDDFVGLTGVYGGQYETAKQHKYSKNFGLEKSLVLSLQKKFYSKNRSKIHAVNKILMKDMNQYPYLNNAKYPRKRAKQQVYSQRS